MTNNLERRLLDHNERGHGWTARYRPWQIIHSECFDNKTSALKRERELKSARGRRFIRENILKQ
jgi:putative endonuclease